MIIQLGDLSTCLFSEWKYWTRYHTVWGPELRGMISGEPERVSGELKLNEFEGYERILYSKLAVILILNLRPI